MQVSEMWKEAANREAGVGQAWPPVVRAAGKGVEYTRRAPLDGNFSLILLNLAGRNPWGLGTGDKCYFCNSERR